MMERRDLKKNLQKLFMDGQGKYGTNKETTIKTNLLIFRPLYENTCSYMYSQERLTLSSVAQYRGSAL